MSGILERVAKIISTQLGVGIEKVQADTKLIEDLGADSLDTVELVILLEEAFDIEIPERVADKIETVGDAVAFIEKTVEPVAA